MDMQKSDIALDKAIESGDPQLGKWRPRKSGHPLLVCMRLSLNNFFFF